LSTVTVPSGAQLIRRIPPDCGVAWQAVDQGRLQGWSPYTLEFWNVGKTLNAPIEVPTLAAFSHDGGTPVFHRYGLNLGAPGHPNVAVRRVPPGSLASWLRQHGATQASA
jgi:hypothetical protein